VAHIIYIYDRFTSIIITLITVNFRRKSSSYSPERDIILCNLLYYLHTIFRSQSRAAVYYTYYRSVGSIVVVVLHHGECEKRDAKINLFVHLTCGLYVKKTQWAKREAKQIIE